MKAKVFSRSFSVFRAHSHTTMRFQPSAAHAFSCSASRQTLRRNLASQKSQLVFGRVAVGQTVVCTSFRPFHSQPCWCQKHPRTSMSVRHLGTTMSGWPTIRLSQTRKRYPFAHSIFLTRISGSVSRECIADMISERLSLHTVSISHFSTRLLSRQPCALCASLPGSPDCASRRTRAPPRRWGVPPRRRRGRGAC